ncbi:MAG: LysR family transcriptional regulator [Myxococcota bacterium]
MTDSNPRHERLNIDATRSLNWSALKDFLAVAESGSLSEAARRLGVSQPTLTRRMAALEDSLRAEIFRRSPRGLALTEVGEALLGPARQMEEGAQAAELAVSGRDLTLEGLVRITATEGLAVSWLTPQLADFRRQQPHIDVELIVRNTALNVLRREADIALRLGRPQQAELVAKRICDLKLGLYASRAYIDEMGRPESPADLVNHRGVAFDEGDVYTGAGGFLEKALGGAHVVYRANTLGAQLAAIRAGLGVGGQSCFIADRDPELVRVIPETVVNFEIWLVTHPGLRRSARIRAMYDFLAERLAASAPLFAGEKAAA